MNEAPKPDKDVADLLTDYLETYWRELSSGQRNVVLAQLAVPLPADPQMTAADQQNEGLARAAAQGRFAAAWGLVQAMHSDVPDVRQAAEWAAAGTGADELPRPTGAKPAKQEHASEPAQP